MSETVVIRTADVGPRELLDREGQLRAIVEEYATRLAEGESPDPYELLVLHSPLARELEERLTLVEQLYASRRSEELLATRAACGSRSEPQPDVLAQTVVACAAHSHSSAHPNQPRTIGRYQVRERLGAGWSAVVYRAWDPKLQREVALKVLKEEVSRDRMTALRFAREAPIVARLRHPHIVPLHESGEAGGLRYLDTELVAGQTLHERLAAGPALDFRQAAQLVLKLAAALDYAHEQGVVHRDIKPSNILIDASGEPQLTDFGLASCAGAFESLTIDGQLIGTPAYMSPEQVAGDRTAVDRRSDVYGLGVVLYRLLTGSLPFEPGDSYATLVYRIAHESPPRPRSVRPAIPKVLEAICLKALEKSPADRFATAAEFGDELRRWLDDEPSRLQSPTWFGMAARWARRNRALAWTGGVASIAVALSLAVAAWSRWQQGVHAQAEAYAQMVTLQDTARQRLRQATQHRRAEALELLQRAAGQRLLVADGPQAERLDLEQRSLFAAWLATHDFPIVQEAKLDGPWHRTWPVAIHPDGRSLAIGTSERPLVWRRGEDLRPPDGMANPQRGGRVEFTPDGKFLLHAGDGGGMQAWDTAATQLAGNWQPDGISPVLAIGFPASGDEVVACCASGQVVCLTLPKLEEANQWPLPKSDVRWTTAAFDASASRIARGDDQGHLEIQAADGRLIAEIEADPTRIEALAFSPSGRQLAAGAKSGVVRVWDIELRHASVPYYLGITGVGCVQFSPDGRWLLAGQRAAPTKVWDLATGRLAMSGPGMSSTRLARDGRTMAVGTSKQIYFCQLAPAQVIRELSGHERNVQQAVWSADSRRLATLDTGFQIHVWEPGSHVPVYSTRVPAEDYYAHQSNAALALSTNGRYMAYASGGQNVSYLAMRDCQTCELLWSGNLGAGYEHLAATGNDEFLLAREEHDSSGITLQTVLYRWSACGPPERWKVLRPGLPGEHGFFQGAFTPDGCQFVWSGPRNSPVQRVEIWDIATGRVRRIPRQMRDPKLETNFSVSAEGRILHVGSGHNSGHIFDLRSGRSRAVASWPLCVSPKGEWLLSGQSTGEWYLCRGEESPPWLRFAFGGDDPLSCSRGMSFSPDGRYFAWGNERGTVRVADLRELQKQVAAFENGAWQSPGK